MAPLPEAKARPADSPDSEARRLHECLKDLEEDESTPPEIRRQLRLLLFLKRTRLVGGVARPSVASSAETLACISELLRRRKAFMRAHKLRDDGANKYIFSDEMRAALFKQWKEEFHADPMQRNLQLRDSWESTASTSAASQRAASMGPDRALSPPPRTWGPNNAAVREGKDVRFVRHLERLGGSRQMIEVILFTGRADIEMLRNVADRGAPQPAEGLAAGKVPERRLKKGETELLKNHAKGEPQGDAPSSTTGRTGAIVENAKPIPDEDLTATQRGRSRSNLHNCAPIRHEDILRTKRQRRDDRHDRTEAWRQRRSRLT